MHLLDLLAGSDLASADGPDGFVCHHHEVPVSDSTHEGVNLTSDDFAYATFLTLGEVLTNTHGGVQLGLLRKSDLGRHNLVGLTEEGAPLGVTDQRPLEAEVVQHRDGELAGEGATLYLRKVLHADLESLEVEGLQGLRDEKRGGEKNDVCSCD
ncbi:deoxyribose-phosphate aldolase [Babesia caballi]|uniref:Deoxyribose-phosphate aldolase n=1 Tax=Babesia caballi TaxID=5871 RepID=A0AAV4M053_BABCB|nr:deoxyribose-phosphate aldolase [Babesia caballi]